MALYKVTIKGKIDKTFYVRAETDDIARDIVMDELLGYPLGYFPIVCGDVDEVEEGEVDEEEVLRR